MLSINHDLISFFHAVFIFKLSHSIIKLSHLIFINGSIITSKTLLKQLFPRHLLQCRGSLSWLESILGWNDVSDGLAEDGFFGSFVGSGGGFER